MILPDSCFSTEKGKLIQIFKKKSWRPVEESLFINPEESVEDCANRLNSNQDIKYPQRLAMEVGAFLGWDKNGANPNHYTYDGLYIPKSMRKNS